MRERGGRDMEREILRERERERDMEREREIEIWRERERETEREMERRDCVQLKEIVWREKLKGGLCAPSKFNMLLLFKE